MSLFRRERTPSPFEQDPADVFGEATDVAAQLYHDSLQNRTSYITDLEGREASFIGVEKPPSMYGHSSLEGAYLPANPKSKNNFERATGKIVTFHIPEGTKDPLAQLETGATDLAIVNLRAAPGRVYYDFARKQYEDRGEPWPYDASERMLAIFRFSRKTGEFHFINGLSDNHPVNELPMMVAPDPDNKQQLLYSYGLPWYPVLDEEISIQTTGKIPVRDPRTGKITDYLSYEEVTGMKTYEELTPEIILEGIQVMQFLMSRGVKRIQDLPPHEVKQLGADAIRHFELLSKDGMSSIPYRMAKTYNNLLAQEKRRSSRRSAPQTIESEDGFTYTETGDFDAQTIKKIGDKLIMAACYEFVVARLKRQSQPGSGVFGQLGILDASDPSMKEFTMRLARQGGIDLRDPNQRNILQGAVYVGSGKVLPEGMEMQHMGEPQWKLAQGVLLNTPEHYAPYRGFSFEENMIEEISNGMPDGGTPMMPGLLTLLRVPRTRVEAGYDYDALAVVDLMEAPGYLMEHFLFHHDPMQPYYHPDNAHQQMATLADILKGKFVGSARGTAADKLSRSVHAILRLDGKVTDDRGIDRGFTSVDLIETQQAFQAKITVRQPNPEGKSKELVPYQGSEPLQLSIGQAIPLIPKRRYRAGESPDKAMHPRKYDRLVRQGLQPVLRSLLEHNPVTEIEAVSTITDSHGVLHVRIFDEKSAEEFAKRNPDLPKPPDVKIRTMSAGNKEMD